MQTFVNFNPPISKIDSVTFRVLTDEISERLSASNISNDKLTSEDLGGLFDPHLGSLSEQKPCFSCYNTRKNCQGHSGMLLMRHPYLLPQFDQNVKTIIRKTCLNCYRIVGNGKKCKACNKQAPIVKDQKGMKILVQFDGKKMVLDPRQIKNILNNIDLDTATRELGIGISPADLISNSLFISSPVIRPDKRVQSQFKNSDDFTVSLANIVKLAIELNSMNENSPKFEETYNSLCQLLSSYHKGDADAADDGKQTKSVSGSMSSKEGRIRGNMMGKKANNMGRAVIACDSSNPPDVITIPIEFAMQIYAKEVVRDYNRERLQQVFNNGPTQYPGATYIVKMDGKRYQIGNANVQMEEGDTIFRHLQTGDYVLLNRQPSLLPASICTHKIRVATQPGTDTLDLNVIACSLYNADFDGDEMNIIIVTTQQSLAEAQYVSTINNRVISMKNNSLVIEQVQDSVIGGYLITRDKYKFDDMFALRVHQNTRIQPNMKKFPGQKTGKQILSMVLPNVNYRGKSTFYYPEFEQYIKYKPTDKTLRIDLGEIKEGYFDNSAKHFLKQIALMYDPKASLDSIFSVQQALLNFNKYHAFSVGINDFYVKQEVRQVIQQKKDNIMQKGYDIILNYAKNNMIMNPLEQSKYDFMIDTLYRAAFGDCVEELMMIPEFKENETTNNLYNMVLSGSKGKFTNLKNMLVMIGFVMVDNEPLKQAFQGRMNMFYKRFDLDPRSLGVILNSYQSGLTPCELLYNSIPERIQMLQKVLSVAKAGSMGRKMIKNFETLILSHTRAVRKRFCITQTLYGYDGFQIQTLCSYRIPNVYDSEQDFINKFLQLSPVESAKSKCKEYAQHISKLVQMYKVLMISQQKVSDQCPFKDEISVPIAIESLLSTRIYQLPDKTPKEQYIIDNCKKLRQFIDDMGYIYFNTNLKQLRRAIPKMYHDATLLIKIAIGTCFTLDKLSIFNPLQLDALLADIQQYLQQNLIEYGTPIGINTAQCFQEFLTQALLDSIHKTGSGRVKKSNIDRLSEIFTIKDEFTMKTPPIIRIPLVTGVTQQRAEYIANRIKLIQLSHLIDSSKMLFTDFENLDRPNAQNASDLEFVRGSRLSDNVTKWCLRVELDKMKLYINSISMQEVKEAIMGKFDVFILSNTEDQARPVLRIYLGSTMTFTSKSQLKEHAQAIIESTVRGVKTIVSANVVPQKIVTIDPATKKLENITNYCIIAEGSNLRQIFKLQAIYGSEIQFSCVTCDCIPLMYKWFGRTATMVKIFNEIKTTLKGEINDRHVYLVADEMLQPGFLTTIETEGIKERNPHNDLLQISESRPIITLRKSALQNKKSYIESLSANMMVGQTPEVGTNYSQILLNENLILKQSQENTEYSDLISQFI